MILCLVWFVGRSKVDLSSATVSFIKGVLGFVADGLSVITPQVIRLNNVWLKPPPPPSPKNKKKRKEKKHHSLFQSQNSKKKRLNFKNKAGNLATRIPIVYNIPIIIIIVIFISRITSKSQYSYNIIKEYLW